MNLPNLSVKRPVTITVVLLIILLFGIFSATSVNLGLLPELNLPVAVVATTYPGAGPDEVENLITRPVEEAMTTVSNLDTISSTSAEGASLVILQFNWGTNIENATLDMREKVDQVKGVLPDDAGDPSVLQFDPNMLPVITLGVSGPEDSAQLQAVAEDLIVPRLERLEGVASVTIDGGRSEEIQVLFDPGTLRSYGISMNQVGQVLQGHNLNLPGGSLDEGGRSFTVRTTAQFQSVEQIRDVRIPTAAGSVMRLGNIAEVRETTAEATSLTRLNGTPSLGLSIQKESGANTVNVSNRVQDELAAMRSELPGNFEVATVLDQAEFILLSIQSVIQNILIGAVLAIIILMVFLRDWRSTLVIGIAIPFSAVAAFSLIYFSGTTLNLLSMGGLALGIGMMVDNAIVVLENVFRMRQEGIAPEAAAIDGSNEVAAAIIASTLTTLSVFLPVIFVEGIAAELFRDLSLTVSFALAASLLVALTAVPLLASRMFRQISSASLTAFSTGGNRDGQDSQDGHTNGEREGGMAGRYRRFLRWSVNHRGSLIGGLVVLFVASAALIPFVSGEFLPAVDQGQIIVSAELPAGSTLERTNRVMSQLEEKAMSVPEMESVFTYVGTSSSEQMSGIGGGGATDTGEMQLILVDQSQRDRSTFEVADELRQMFAQVPGVEVTVTDNLMSGGAGGGGAASSLGGGFGGPPIVVDVTGDDQETLRRLTNQVADEIEAISGTTEVSTSFDQGLPELQIVVDRRRAASLGVTPAQVAQAVRTAMNGQTVTRYRKEGSEIDVVLKFHEEAVSDRSELQNMPIETPRGMVPLQELAELEQGRGPTQITRNDQTRAANVTANVVDRPTAEVTAELRQRLDSLDVPAGYSIDMGGEQELMSDAFSNLAIAAVIGFILMYLIMAAQFESFVFPVSVILTVPMSLIGAVVALAVTGRSFNAASFIGVIMVMGVIVNNAIVLIDYINQLRNRGRSRREAIIEGGTVRLRPVLMTALTTILAMIPLALGLGEGSEIQAPLATVVIGGLLIGTVLTLVVLPVIYSLLDDWAGGRPVPETSTEAEGSSTDRAALTPATTEGD